MKIKKKIFTFLFSILFLNVNYAQDLGFCGTKQEPLLTPISIMDIGSSKYSTTNEQIVLSVKIHFISNNIPDDEQEQKALDAVAALNLSFNSGNIFFKYKGYDNIDNDDLLDVNSADTITLFNYSSYDWIDVFIVNRNGSASGQVYTFNYPIINGNGGGINKKYIVLIKEYLPVVNTTTPTNLELKQNTLSHEMGHYLGLYHTFTRWRYNDDGDLVPLTSSYEGCDITYFEENLDNSEWNIYGDLIQDTNPDRILRHYSNSWYPFLGCGNIVFNELHTHCGNTLDVNLFNPPLTNIMSYYGLCTNTFTQGQYDYARAYIELHRQGFLENEFNTVDSLYEPYVGTYVSCGAITNPAKLQKGFDYSFVDCHTGPYADYPVSNIDGNEYATGHLMSTANVFETPNHPIRTAIIINQLNSRYTNKCYSYCYKGASSGKILKFNTNVPSNNYTEQYLDSTQINNPNLIQSLQNGLHKIEKNYYDGYKIEKLIYKTQN